MANRKLQIDVEVEIARAKRRLDELDRKLRGVGTSAVGAGKSTTGAVAAFKGFAGAIVALEGVRRAFRFAVTATIDMNAKLETTTLQFKTLMGSSRLAEDHVRSLFDFAKRTPFETQSVIEASRQLQVFGGFALNTEEMLSRIGNASAATSAPMQELAMWTGRLFAQLQTGGKFGEAAQRLTELAVLTPQARQEMEALQEAGASAAEIFAVFTDQLDEFSGAMEEQADTFTGLLSTFTDGVTLAIADTAAPLFEMFKDVLRAANETLAELNADPVQRQIDGMTASIERNVAILNRQIELSGTYDEALARNTARLQDHVLALTSTVREREKVEAAQQAELDALREEEAALQRATAEKAKAAEAAATFAKAQEALNKKFREGVTDLRELWGMYTRLTTTIPDITQNIDMQQVSWLSADRTIADVNIGLIEARRNFGNLREALNPPGGFFGGFLGGLRSVLNGLTGGRGFSGFLSNLGTGIAEGFGNIISGGLTGLISSGVSALVGGVGSLFRRIFGGPSEAELAGREFGNNFIDGVIDAADVSSDRVADAIAQGWDPRLAEFALAAQDVFTKAGLSVQDAMLWVQRFFDAIKDGPDALQVLIDQFDVLVAQNQQLGEEMDDTFKDRAVGVRFDVDSSELDRAFKRLGSIDGSSIQRATPGAAPDTPTPLHFGGIVQAFPGGGVVSGLSDHVPALLQPGEFVMNRQAVNRIGLGTLGAMNRGSGGGGLTVNATITVAGYLENPQTQRRLGQIASEEIMRELSRRRVVTGLV